MRHNAKCNCQKQISFAPRQLQLEGQSIKTKLQKKFERHSNNMEKVSKTSN